MTLPELLVGVALSAMIALVLARMFQVTLRAAQATLRQSGTLASSRRALVNAGPHRGMLWAAREALQARSLSTSTLELSLPVLSEYAYAVSGETLVKTQDGVEWAQATGVSSLTLSYFEIDASGRIFASTAASSASYVQVRLTATGRGPRERRYDFVSGAWLRNR